MACKSFYFSHSKKSPKIPAQSLSNITFDHRAFIIGGKRQLLLTGAIHYPRSTPGMWPELLKKSKEAGLNTIETYVFWNLHEPREGIYDFETDYANLPLFLQMAQDHGLYVVLRIGPYVCAEWNLGGLPSWLLQKPGIVFRTWNEPFMTQMEKFVRKTVQVVKPFMATTGGPIIAMQMENEYGNVEYDYGSDGHRYIVWAADLANSLDTGVPWFMCQQDRVSTVILACNGFYCDNWIKSHWRKYPATPPMFTELWTGWFQHWKTPKLTRPTADLAFSVARWFAKGGSFISYYMFHGGTNFGRWGSDFKTTSYDYDAPINEYGFPAIPKYLHLKRLHAILNEYSEIILEKEPIFQKLGSKQVISHFFIFQEAHIYGNMMSGPILAFLSNSDEVRESLVEFSGKAYRIPKWTVILLATSSDGSLSQVFSTSSIIAPHANELQSLVRQTPETSDLRAHVQESSIGWIQEPVGIWESSMAVSAPRPLEQIRLTNDETDYLWYINQDFDLPSDLSENLVVTIEPATDILYVYLGDYLMHSREVSVMNVNMNQLNNFMATNSAQGSFYLTHTIVVITPMALAKASRLSKPTLSILSATMGLVNYGSHYENVQKGISGRIFVNGRDITKGKWSHQIGLLGEYKRYYDPTIHHAWVTSGSKPIHTPLTWYQLTIGPDQVKNMIKSSNALTDSRSSSYFTFALYLGTMGKGHAWVNGHAVGRYWDVSSPAECRICLWSGGFYSNKCPENCGTPCQEYYHVPFDWVLAKDGRIQTVDIVLFEERGGDPTGVQLVMLN